MLLNETMGGLIANSLWYELIAVKWYTGVNGEREPSISWKSKEPRGVHIPHRSKRPEHILCKSVGTQDALMIGAGDSANLCIQLVALPIHIRG